MKNQLLILATLLYGAVGISQNNFAPPVENPFGISGIPSNQVCKPHWVDLDNDGDLDILSQVGTAFYYFENTGTVTSPVYAAPLSNPFGLQSVAGGGTVSLADINNNGTLDLISGSLNGYHLVWINVGTPSNPSFNSAATDPWNLPQHATQNSPEWVDLDNDGDFDIVTGSTQGDWGYYENIGTATSPNYGPLQNNPFGFFDDGNKNNAFFIDFDGDNDLDMFAGRQNAGTITYYQNTGTISSPTFPGRISNPFGFSGNYSNTSPALADIDNDGDLDMILGTLGNTLKFYENTLFTSGGTNVAPTAACQNITVVLDSNGDATITAAMIDNGSADTDGTFTLSAGQTIFNCTDLGTNNVTLTVTDDDGDTATCTAVVTITDTQAPVLTVVPANILQDTDAGECGAFVGFSISGSDNCNASISNDAPGGNNFPIGTTTVNVTITDTSGNTDTGSFTVTINDVEDPVLSLPSNVVQDADAGECGAFVSLSISGSDNCSAAISHDIPAGSNFPIGTTTVNATVTDASGNTATGSFTVTINDAELPTMVCPANEVVMVPQGTQYTLPDYVADGDAVAMDNCSFITAQTPAAGTDLAPGTHTIEFEVADASGNIADCSFQLTVDEVLAVGDNDSVDFKLYPNPATTQITIKGNFNIATVDVFNLLGQKVMTSISETLNIQDLASAMYLVTIIDTEGNKATKRFIKK